MPIVLTDSQHYTDIANAIRRSTNLDDKTYKPSEMAGGILEVYESARRETIEQIKKELWQAFTLDGVRTRYSDAFSRMNLDYLPFDFTEDRPIVPTKDIDRMFYIYYGSTLPNIDLSKVPASLSCQSLFASSKLTVIRNVGLRAMNSYLNVFNDCSELVTIEFLDSKQSTVYTSTFEGCSKLQNITFGGVIGQNIDLSDSPELSKKSILDLFEHLYNYKGTGITCTVTIGSTNKAKCSASELQIATNKGWTVV